MAERTPTEQKVAQEQLGWGLGAGGVNIPRAGGSVPHLVDPSRRNDPHRTDEEPVSWRA